MSVELNKGIKGIKSNTQYYKEGFDGNGKSIGINYHMADQNKELFEIQRTNNFDFVIRDASKLKYRAASNQGKQYTQNAQEVISLSVVRTTVPHFTQDVIKVQRGNSTLKYAGVPSFDSGTLEVNDFIGIDSKSILMAWQDLSYNVMTEKVGLAQDYKIDCSLIEYAPDGQKVREWLLHGCWVSKIQEGDYNAEQNQKKTVTATIEYDRAEITYN